jgi:hypothetical protein
VFVTERATDGSWAAGVAATGFEAEGHSIARERRTTVVAVVAGAECILGSSVPTGRWNVVRFERVGKIVTPVDKRKAQL